MEASENELSIPIDYVPGARGHGVLAVGPDSGGDEALAVWRLSPTGRAGGAWVVRFDEIDRDPEQLRRIMWMLQDRCLVDWDRETPTGVLARIAELLPAELLSALGGNILTIPELLTEIREHRSTYTAAVERHRAGAKSKIAPLAWPTEMPDQQNLGRLGCPDRVHVGVTGRGDGPGADCRRGQYRPAVAGHRAGAAAPRRRHGYGAATQPGGKL